MKLIGFFIAFVIGVIASSAFILSTSTPNCSSTVQVRIHNDSGMAISDIVVKHEDGLVALNSLAAGKSQALPVLVFGESSYQIQATLSNGKVVIGRGGYVEPGYIIEEVVKQNGIEREVISSY